MVTELPKEPNNFKEAMTSPDNAEWKNAAEEKMESLRSNKTWQLIERKSDWL